MSMIEEVTAIKQEQEAQRGDLVRINNSINEMIKSMQDTTSAINNMSIKCDQLMDALQMQHASDNDELTQEMVRTIIAEEIKDIKQDGATVFEPLSKKVAELNKEFTDAGNVAAKKIRNAGKPDWLELFVRGMIAAVWYVVITCGVMYWGYGIKDIHKDLTYLRDRINVIQYNQTIPGANFTPWDMEEFHKVWENQDEYIKSERNKKAKG